MSDVSTQLADRVLPRGSVPGGPWYCRIVGVRGIEALLVCVATSCRFDSAGLGSDASEGSSDETSGVSSGASTTAADSGATAGGPSETGGSSVGTGAATNDETSGETGDKPLLPEFGAPLPVPELNTVDAEDDPSLTGDMLEIYFATFRFGGPGGEDIWVARRESVDDPFETPQPVYDLSSAAEDATPEVSTDGLVMRFASSRFGGLGGLDLWISTRPTRDSGWSGPMHIADLSSQDFEGGPVLTADALTMFFCSNRNGGQDDIFTATRTGVGQPWGPAQTVPMLSVAERDCNMWIDANANIGFFASSRPGGAGQEDIWVSLPTNGIFGKPQNMVELNTDALDDDPWLSPDLQTIYFASDRLGNSDIWRAERLPP